MKHFILLCIALLLATTVFSQNYVPIEFNASQWNYKKLSDGIGMGSCQEYSYYFKGDTLINGVQYHKLYKVGVNYKNDINFPCDYKTIWATFDSLFMMIRNDTANKKVYARTPQNQNEKLLFDFDLKVGDTLRSELIDSTSNFTVSKISTDSIAGKNRKLFHLNPYQQDTLVEGIGFLRGDFESMTFVAIEYTLNCYKEGSHTYPKNKNCNLITKIKQYTKESEGLVLAPNPTKGHIELSTKANLKKITVYNLQGQVVQKINPKKRSWELPEKSGMYLIRITDENGNYFTKKIIKN